MDTNNYIGSFAQENVTFQTVVVTSSSYGDNFKRVMIFTEKSLITDTDYLLPVDGSDTVKAATVTVDDYASVTTGILQSWLTDLFANGETEDVYLVINGDDALTAELQEEAYELLKAHAYFKTVCVPDTTTDPQTPDLAELDASRFNTLASALAQLCVVDKEVLSSPVLAPISTALAANYADDPRYIALKDKFVFMSYHQDATRNAALYALGLALSINNTSGTPVGNSFDMVKSNGITSNGLKKVVRSTLNAAYIQTWKAIGDNSSNVAAESDRDLMGNYMEVLWLKARIAYMVKVEVAVLMTTVNFYKNESNYQQILAILGNNLGAFKGRLTNIHIIAPSFDQLPSSASDRLVIDNAWKATYVDHTRQVDISGTLYVGEE